MNCEAAEDVSTISIILLVTLKHERRALELTTTDATRGTTVDLLYTTIVWLIYFLLLLAN